MPAVLRLSVVESGPLPHLDEDRVRDQRRFEQGAAHLRVEAA